MTQSDQQNIRIVIVANQPLQSVLMRLLKQIDVEAKPFEVPLNAYSAIGHLGGLELLLIKPEGLKGWDGFSFLMQLRTVLGKEGKTFKTIVFGSGKETFSRAALAAVDRYIHLPFSAWEFYGTLKSMFPELSVEVVPSSALMQDPFELFVSDDQSED